MTTNIVETLYYKLYNSVLLGESNEAKMYLELLREEYTNNSESFLIFENDERFDHLKQLGNLVDNGLLIRNSNYNLNTSTVQTANTDDNQAETEIELIKIIFSIEDNLQKLRKCLNTSEKFCVANIQHPTLFGRIDVLAIDGDTVYAIEIKKSEARYSVISQIEKYVLDLKLKLILKVWKKVVGVVIANGYVNQVVKELVKSDVIAIKYSLKNDNDITFRKLTSLEKDNDLECDNSFQKIVSEKNEVKEKEVVPEPEPMRKRRKNKNKVYL